MEESGENGFIVFTLGSVSSSKHMPRKHVNTFLKTFAKLPQKVIWKWDSEDQPENVPSNVLLFKWLPQQDLLGMCMDILQKILLCFAYTYEIIQVNPMPVYSLRTEDFLVCKNRSITGFLF